MTSGIFKNPGLKLLSFVIAVSLWVLVAGGEESVKVFDIPIDFALSKDRILSSDTPGTVQVRVRGSESILRHLGADSLSLPIDLTPYPLGHRSVEVLSPKKVRGVPSGAAVEAITPERLEILVERKISRVIGVAARLEGETPVGYRLLESRTEPDRLTIEGPESEVSRTPVAYTEPVPLQERRGSFSVEVPVAMENARIVLVGPRKVTVTVRIEEEARR